MLLLKDAHKGATIWCLAALPGNQEIFASCGSDCCTRFWNGKTGQEIACISNLHSRTIRSIAFLPLPSAQSGNSWLLAQGSWDGTTTLVSISLSTSTSSLEWTFITRLEGHESEVKAVAWNQASQMLATCSRDRTIWIWGWQGSPEFILQAEWECLGILGTGLSMQDVKHVTWHPCKPLLGCCGYDGSVRVFGEGGPQGLDDWEQIWVQNQAHSGMIVWQGVWIEERVFGTVGEDSVLRIWDSVKGEQIASIQMPEGAGTLWCISVEPAAQRKCVQEELNYNEMKGVQEESNCNGREDFDQRLDCDGKLDVQPTLDCDSHNFSHSHPIVKRMAIGCGGDCKIRIIEWKRSCQVTSLRICATLPLGHMADVNSVAWIGGDGTRIASCSDDGNIVIYQADDLELE